MTSPCVSGSPEYFVEVDWADDDVWTDPNDDVSSHLTMKTEVATEYGRDDARALAPIASGQMKFELCDPDATFSPDNPDSPIMNDIEPGRPSRVRINFQSTDHIIFSGHIDNIEIKPNRFSQNVPITVFDGIAKLKGTNFSTDVWQGIQTGEAINHILDAISWPSGKRQIDVGATTIPWWWESGASAFEAVKRIVNAEGPPAIAYVEPEEGNFVFEDRNHRLFRERSQVSQATFCTNPTDCGIEDEPCPTGSFNYTDPFEYDAGWRDIVNQVAFNVDVMKRVQYEEEVWASDDVIVVQDGETLPVKMVLDDPVIGPLSFETENIWGSGTLIDATINRTSGQTITLFLEAAGGPVHILGLSLRGYPVRTARTIEVSREDQTSIDTYGLRDWPNSDTPFLNPNDADAIAQKILHKYSTTTSLVRLRVAVCDGEYLDKILDLQIGDRITIHNKKFELNDDFTIERVEHTIRGRGRLHIVVFACERIKKQFDDAFTFNVQSLGFDSGVFGQSGFIDPDLIFRFGVAGQGFDDGQFGY